MFHLTVASRRQVAEHLSTVPSRIFKQHPEHESAVIENCLDTVTRAASKVNSRVGVLNANAVVDTHLGVQLVAGGIMELTKTQSESETRAIAREDSTRQHLQDLAATVHQQFESVTARLAQTVQARTLQAVMQSLLEHGVLAPNSPRLAIAGMK
jgi:G3E family GTPase